MRLFVAIPLPEDVKQHLKGLQQPVEGIRWQASQQYHLTLRFIGEANRKITQAIREQLEIIQSPPFSLSIKAPGYFPENRRPRVLWVGVEEEPSLMRLQEKVEQACRDVRLKPDKRNFKPHITLGKVKSASKRDVLSFIDQHEQFHLNNIQVSEFILYSSRLHPNGAIHTPLEKYSLERNT